MAIAPITGKLRKRFWLDLTTSLGLGIGAGYAYWYGIHLKSFQKHEEFYYRLEQAKKAEQS